MDVFDKQEAILNRHIAMLKGEVNPDELFIALVHFQNWIGRSGLSGYVQDYTFSDLKLIRKFTDEHQFQVICEMVKIVEQLALKHGENFIDQLNSEEYDALGQFDAAFFDISNRLTETLYLHFIPVT